MLSPTLPAFVSQLRRSWICVGIFVLLAGTFAVASEESQGSNQEITKEDREFWAFRRLVRPTVPNLARDDTIKNQPRNAIDAFVLQKLTENGLSFSPDAAAARLARRVHFDLVGLPPSPEEIDAFLRDTGPDAYVRLVDRLLASPHFGERWGRHWLDVVGYTDLTSYDGDTTGIFGFIEDRWRYRDYVIDALNADKPYNRFLSEQIAGDELVEWRTAKQYTPDVVATLAATGFWRNAEDRSESAKELEYKWSFLHNTMQTFGTSVLGLTLRCARCHDHKHEPIPQRDYFQILSLITPAFNVKNWKNPKQRAIPAISNSTKAELDAFNGSVQKQISARASEIAAVKSARWQELLNSKFELVPEALRAAAKTAVQTAEDKRNEAQRELVGKYGDQLSVKPEEVEESLTAEEKATIAKLNSKVAEHKRSLKSHGWIHAIYDVGPAPATHLLERGEFKTPGPEVQPGFVSVLSSQQSSFEEYTKPVPGSSGRRAALARWLTKANTPASALVARVVVNRIWQHLTGVGIVPTSENLGMSGAKPSHPELLEWLTAEFVENGWRIKPLIKTIMLSTTYRQASRRERTDKRLNPRDIDPENFLLWRARLRRLESEVIRDAMLSTSGRLNGGMGGKPVSLKYRRDGVASFDVEKLKSPSEKWRRSVYLFQRRVYHTTVQGVFDQPIIAGSVCRRNSSAVALQSLTMLNDEFALEQSGHFANRVWGRACDSPIKQTKAAFQLALNRPPDEREIQWSTELLKRQTERYQKNEKQKDVAPRKALMHLCRVLFNSSEFLYVE